MTVNERIKILRQNLRINQTNFAAAIGVTQTGLSQIERKRAGVSFGVFKSISDKFKVRLDWLMSGEGEMFKDKKTEPAQPINLIVTDSERTIQDVPSMAKDNPFTHLERIIDSQHLVIKNQQEVINLLKEKINRLERAKYPKVKEAFDEPLPINQS